MKIQRGICSGEWFSFHHSLSVVYEMWLGKGSTCPMPFFADCDIDDFRNDMHLGPSAHRLMAAEIYHGIDGIMLNPNGTEKRHNRGFAA